MRIVRRGLHIECDTYRIVPDKLLEMCASGELSPRALHLWLTMQQMVFQGLPLTRRRIAQRAGMSLATVRRSLAELRELGLVKRERERYKVVFGDPPAEAEAGGVKIDPGGGSKLTLGRVKIDPGEGQKRPGGGSNLTLSRVQNSPILHGYIYRDSGDFPRGAAFEPESESTRTASSDSDSLYISSEGASPTATSEVSGDSASATESADERAELLQRFRELYKQDPEIAGARSWACIYMCVHAPQSRLAREYLARLGISGDADG